MNRKFGIGILVFCFGLSSLNASLAAQVIEISPVIVQPCDLREISQQMLGQDRVNRDQELAMIHYRDALLSRVWARIAANSQEVSKYHDVIALTEDVDAMKGVGPLTERKDETIRWLNQVVAVAKNKAEYYRLTSQQDRLTMEQVQEEEQQIRGRLGAQLSQKQQQVDLLKKELDSKNAQSDQMALMMSDYQKKLESKDNAYNQELGQVLLAKGDQVQMEKQVAYLNAQLQEKEAQVVKIKKGMYDLQELMSVKDRDLQAKNLSLSIELALARQKLNGMPGSDEINFLRTGLKVAAVQLKQKDEMLSQIKANADEYEKEFKGQTREFQSLKDQLLNAQMEITRLKDRPPMSGSGLQKQVMILTQKLEASEKKLRIKTHENEVGILEAQLRSANLKIKDLQSQLNQLNAPSKGDRLREKLKQALDEIDKQGRMINVLAQKLQDAGQNVNLTQHFTKS